MDNKLKIILIVVLSLAAINSVVAFFQKSQLKQIQKNIELSQININTALKDIQASQEKIEAMQKDISDYKSYLSNTQTTVEILNTKKDLEEAKARGVISSGLVNIRHRLDSLKAEREKLISQSTIEN